MMTANQTMQLVGSWPDLGRVLVGSWVTLGHSWGTLGRFLGTLGPIGRALAGIRVDSDLDSVGIVFLRDDRFRKAMFLPVPVEIGKAHAGAFADVDEGEDVEDMRIAGVAGSALNGNRLVDAENARIGEADRLRLFLDDDAAMTMIVGNQNLPPTSFAPRRITPPSVFAKALYDSHRESGSPPDASFRFSVPPHLTTSQWPVLELPIRFIKDLRVNALI